MGESYAMEPIGHVRSSRTEPTDDGWDAETQTIELCEPFGGAALVGLEAFSHAVVVFVFDRATGGGGPALRRPRGNPDWPEIGIFAQRAKDRPNRIGVSTCRILGVRGTTLQVAGLDAIDGTPVLDIKPHMDGFGPRGPTHQPAWADELLDGYW
jgi:tRNA-Thr(GGU) m(6)t(6)A37 methyltransferase TsaA